MKRIFSLSKLRCKKLNRLIKVSLGKYYTIDKLNNIRYSKTLFGYLFKPNRIDALTFCLSYLPTFFRVSKAKYGQTVEAIIDNSYSNFILREYDMSVTGVHFKFNSIRNLFRFGMRYDDYVVNHYANRLTLPLLKLLKEEYGDLDFNSLIVSLPVRIKVRVRELENGIVSYVRSQFDLMRAGPDTCIRLKLVA